MSIVRVPVAAQPPTGPPTSLLDMALLPDGEGDRWQGGFSWLPRQCAALAGFNDCAPSATVVYRTGVNSRRSHQPVILQVENPCQSTFGTSWDEERQNTLDLMVAFESAGAEAELWDGTLARAAVNGGDDTYTGNLWLTKQDVATDLTGGVAVSPARGLGLLEQFLADTGAGSQGMIHLQPQLVPNVGVRNVGRQLLTVRGNFLVPGSGYTGHGPSSTAVGARTVTDGTTSSNTTVTSATAAFTAADVGKTIAGTGIPVGTTIASRTNGTTVVLSQAATATATGVTLTITGGAPAVPAAGTAWMFATGRVTYRNSPIQVVPDDIAQAVDRTTNTAVITAQRFSAGTWDSCAVGAVLVTLPA